MKCFYHNADLDGVCSAAIVHLKYPSAELIGINYGDLFPWDSITPGEEVWMVDFSLQPFENMVRLRDLCNLTWIDHHKSAIEEANESSPDEAFCMGLQKVGIGACALVWDYLHDKVRPRAVQLLAEYDVWKHDDPETLPFQYGMRLLDAAHDPTDPAWPDLLSPSAECRSGFERLVDNGAKVLVYIEQDNALKARALCFDHELPAAPPPDTSVMTTLTEEELDRLIGPRVGIGPSKLRCLAANFGPCNSQLFDSLWDPKRYDAMLLYSYRPKNKQWTISLYTSRDDVDVSAVAKAYGGGGHKGAAGFQVHSLKEIGL